MVKYLLHDFQVDIQLSTNCKDECLGRDHGSVDLFRAGSMSFDFSMISCHLVEIQ